MNASQTAPTSPPGAHQPVGIFMGANVDDSAHPPSAEQNRLLADLVLHYACAPFISASPSHDEPAPPHSSNSGSTAFPHQYVQQEPHLSPLRPHLVEHYALWPHVHISSNNCSASNPVTTSPRRGGGGGGNSEAPPSPIFYWYNQRFPNVGTEEMAADTHDPAYINYLKVRETLSEVDELGKRIATTTTTMVTSAIAPPVQEGASGAGGAETPTKRSVVESLSPPSYARRLTAELGGSGALPSLQSVTSSAVYSSNCAAGELPPLRRLPDLLPVAADEDYGLVQDARPFVGLWRSLTTTVSGTLHAVRWLLGKDGHGESKERMAAIHWFGGRHRARRNSAMDFCYVNDVVLGARALQRGLPPDRNKVLIVDLGAHPGDGTESSLLYDPQFFSLSIHVRTPTTTAATGGGDAREAGRGLAKGMVLNLPLPPGATDALYVPLARHAVRAAMHLLGDSVGAVVLVCGADALQGDPLGQLNLTIAGLQSVVRLVIDFVDEKNLKLLLLGCGGYVDTSTARLSAVVTRDVLSCAAARQHGAPPEARYAASPWMMDLGVPVPDSSQFFTRYGSSFLMHGLPPARLPRVNELRVDDPYYQKYVELKEAAKTRQTNHAEGSVAGRDASRRCSFPSVQFNSL